MTHSDSPTPIRTPSVRTETPEQVGGSGSVQDAGIRGESAANDSLRTKQESSASLNKKPPTGPGGWARVAAADFFDTAIERRWDSNEYWASNRALAKQTKQDEKVIRQLRDGRKALSVAMLLVLPAPLVADVVSWIQDKRALTPHRRALPMLREALDRIEQPIDSNDREETMRALFDAQERIGARLKKLMTEGK